MTRALLIVAALAGAARADDFEDLGNCRAQVFGARDKAPSRVVTIERDAKHRIAKETTVLAGGTKLVQTRAYDDKGRLATIQIEDVRVVNEYDAKTGRLGRTLELVGKDAATPSRVWTREYDPAGRLVHEVAREGDRNTIDKTFTYDKAGRVATISMDRGATTEAHAYDDKGHLVRNDVVVNDQKIAFTYRYDDKGRRIEQANPSGRIEYSYECH